MWTSDELQMAARTTKHDPTIMLRYDPTCTFMDCPASSNALPFCRCHSLTSYHLFLQDSPSIASTARGACKLSHTIPDDTFRLTVSQSNSQSVTPWVSQSVLGSVSPY